MSREFPKIIVIDGPDGSGKQTQAELLRDALEESGFKVRLLSFPRYDNPASYFVRRYLNGDYGQNPDDEGPYAASIYYAVDRADLFKTEDFSEDFIIADRYTTSNMIHQGAKIADSGERMKFVDWLEDLEYSKFGIPKPDAVFFLDVKPEVSEELREKRAQEEGAKLDLHERDRTHEVKAYETALELADALGWERIDCAEDGELRSPDSIHRELVGRLFSRSGKATEVI